MNVKYSTIIVKDLDTSIKFYTEVMGFEIDSQYNPQPETIIVLLKGKDGAMIELIQSSQYQPGFYSVGMDVEDLSTTLDELKSKGVIITMGPVPTLVGRLAFTEDPNGVRIALIEHSKVQ
jgi:lactoylglutathione lyase